MSANLDAALATYLRANKVIPPDKIASAQAHQSAVMPNATLPQVLLHLKYISQEALESAVRVVKANSERTQPKADAPPDALSRAMGDARTTGEELAAVAKLISEELKRR